MNIFTVLCNEVVRLIINSKIKWILLMIPINALFHKGCLFIIMHLNNGIAIIWRSWRLFILFDPYRSVNVWRKFWLGTYLRRWGKSETQPNASDLKKELSKGFAQKDFFENQRTPVEIMLLLNSKIQTIILLLSRLLLSMIQILLSNQENAKLETPNIPVN